MLTSQQRQHFYGLVINSFARLHMISLPTFNTFYNNCYLHHFYVCGNVFLKVCEIHTTEIIEGNQNFINKPLIILRKFKKKKM